MTWDTSYISSVLHSTYFSHIYPVLTFLVQDNSSLPRSTSPSTLLNSTLPECVLLLVATVRGTIYLSMHLTCSNINLPRTEFPTPQNGECCLHIPSLTPHSPLDGSVTHKIVVRFWLTRHDLPTRSPAKDARDKFMPHSELQ